MKTELSGSITYIDPDFDFVARSCKDLPARQYREIISEQCLDHRCAGVCPLSKLQYPWLAALGRWLIRISYGNAAN